MAERIDQLKAPLYGKTALITGGSRGIGRATALALADEGADVAIVYAGNTAAAEDTLAALRARGVRAEAYICDVSDNTATKQLIKTVLADFGGLDILVNNAGITADALLCGMREADFDRVIAVNLKGAFNMMRYAAGHFARKRAGRIINIASIVGLSGNAGQCNYAAAKAGLIGLTKSAAKELASRGITCNAIAPGYIDTDMTAVLNEETRSGLLAAIPAKRIGQAEDVAQLAAFLASERAAYITGAVIAVDGGLSM